MVENLDVKGTIEETEPVYLPSVSLGDFDWDRKIERAGSGSPMADFEVRISEKSISFGAELRDALRNGVGIIPSKDRNALFIYPERSGFVIGQNGGMQQPKYLKQCNVPVGVFLAKRAPNGFVAVRT